MSHDQPRDDHPAYTADDHAVFRVGVQRIVRPAEMPETAWRALVGPLVAALNRTAAP